MLVAIYPTYQTINKTELLINSCAPAAIKIFHIYNSRKCVERERAGLSLLREPKARVYSCLCVVLKSIYNLRYTGCLGLFDKAEV